MVLIALVGDSRHWGPEKSVTARFLVVRSMPPATAGASEKSTYWERIGAAWVHVRQRDGPELTLENVIQRLGVKHMDKEMVIC